ncbi:MAG: hypothetical protein EAZ42_09855 [Verrucomicrobia bacterium]|nr:MAG: hypothetical protein EAZ42_09855 [Verrucomicrobiota bacterium]
MNYQNLLAVFLLCVGSLQMLGHTVGSRVLRGVGLASGIAPFTKVFSEVDGYEAFAASFELSGLQEDGSRWSRQLDPQWYSDLNGPYNRRNVYGATLAFAPRLPPLLRDELLHDVLAPNSKLRRELSIPATLKNLTLQITPRSGEQDGPWAYPYHSR